MNSAIFWGEKKGDIQNQSFLPSLSHLLLLVLALDVAKPCSNPFLASFRVSLGPEHHRQQQQQSGWQFFWGGSVWTRVCWGLRGFAPLPTGRMQASCRPCSHANSSPGALSAPICADICGSFISPLASVLQKWAPEHVFYEKLSLLTLFSNESCFLIRDFSPVLSRRCCSKPLAVKHFKHGETAISYGYCGTLLRQGWVSFWGDAQRK